MLLSGTSQKQTVPRQAMAARYHDAVPRYSEFLIANAEDSFERTTIDMALAESRVDRAETEAYGPQHMENPEFFEAYGEHDPSMAMQMEMPGFGTRSTSLPRFAEGKAEYIPKEAWNETHPLYHKNIAWREDLTEVRARIYNEDCIKREQRQHIIERGNEHFGFIQGTIPGFFFGVLGSLPDPVNAAPVGGAVKMGVSAARVFSSHVARSAGGRAIIASAAGVGRSVGRFVGIAESSTAAGAVGHAVLEGATVAGATATGATVGRSIANRTLLGATEGAIGNATADLVVLPDLKSRGADVGFTDFTLDTMFGAVIGGAMGGVGGWRGWRSTYHPQTTWADAGPARHADTALPRNPDTDALRQSINNTDRQSVLNATQLTSEQIANGEAVNVSAVPGIRETVARTQKEALAKLYEDNLFTPNMGDPHTPQVRLAYVSLAEDLGVNLGDIFVDAGSAALRPDGSVKVKTRFGMVKFIWKHGAQGNKPENLQTTKQDILDFPDVLKEYMPIWQEKQQSYGWVVTKEDGRIVLYAANNFTKTTGQSHLVSVHVLKHPEEATLSPKMHIDPSASPGRLVRPAGDTARRALGRLPQGREGSMDPMGNQPITTVSDSVNRFAVEEPEVFLPTPERAASLALNTGTAAAEPKPAPQQLSSQQPTPFPTKQIQPATAQTIPAGSK